MWAATGKDAAVAACGVAAEVSGQSCLPGIHELQSRDAEDSARFKATPVADARLSCDLSCLPSDVDEQRK